MKHMKKIILFLLLVGGFATHAQFVGGGNEETLKNSKTLSTSPWKNRFALLFGPSIPIGAWGKEVEPSATLTDAYTNNTGFGAKRGWMFEMNSTFYLKRLAIPEQMGVGINFTWFGFSFNSFDWSNVSPNLDVVQTPFLFFYGKLGAQYTYSLMPDMYVDAYFNLCPTFGVLGSITDQNYFSESTNYYYTVLPSLAIGTRRNVGIAFRYKVLTAGLDLMMGPMRSTVNYYIEDNRTNLTIADELYPVRFRANTFALRVGFTF
jgi:hypothetical protein